MPFCDNFRDFYIGLQEIVDKSVSINIKEFTGDEYKWNYNYVDNSIYVTLPCKTDILDEVKRINTSLNIIMGLDNLDIFGGIECANKLTDTCVYVRELNILSIEKDCSGMFSGAHFDGHDAITINAHKLVVDSMFTRTNLTEVEFKNCHLTSVEKPFAGSEVSHLILNNCSIELYKYLDYNYGEFACSELLPTLLGNSDIEKITLMNCDESFIEEFMEHVRLVEEFDEFDDLEIVIE
jgi:hypothetical protein